VEFGAITDESVGIVDGGAPGTSDGSDKEADDHGDVRPWRQLCGQWSVNKPH